MKKASHSCFLLLFFVVLRIFPQQYNFHNYSVKDGVAQSQVYSLLQDSRGYLWMGTQGGGITRFDGRNFTTLSVKEGLSGSKVFAIREDRKKNLWIGTMKGLSFYNGISFKKYLSNIAVREIDLDKSGMLWLATDAGVYRQNDTGFVNVSAIMRDRDPNIITLMVDRSGDVWAGSDGLYRISIKNGAYDKTRYSKANGFTNNSITCIRQDSTGLIWIGTYGDGAYAYDGKRFSRFDEHQELYKQTVQDFCFDDKGNVWMATLNSGVAQYSRGTGQFSWFTTNEGLSNNHVHCILQDKSGSYWFGTSGGGVCNYSGKQFTQYDKSSGLNEIYIYTIFRDSRERLWISASDKGVNVYDSARFKPFNAANGFANVKVRAISEDNNGVIYFGTDGQGIYTYDGTDFKQLKGLERKFIRAIEKDKDGNLWLASATGIYKLIITEKGIVVKNFTTKDGLLRDRIGCLHYDKQGRLWYATESGLLGLIVNDHPEDPHIQLKGPLSYNAIWCFAEDRSGYLYVGTDGGIAAFPLYQDAYPLTVYDHTTGLTSSNVYLLSFDQSDNLFVGTETGLDYVKFDQDRRISGIKHYGRGEGFTAVEPCKNAVFNDKDGTIWFGTIEGLSKYSPDNKTKNLVPPVIDITEVMLFNTPLSQTPYKTFVGDWNSVHGLVLPHDQNNISIYFAGINFPNPEAVKYQWRLKGASEAWSPVTAQNNVNFSSLAPGDYAFMVKACNEDGVWSKEPVSLKFSITPPFWRSWWFILIAICVAAAFIIISFRWRVNRIRTKAAEEQKKLQLEKEVVELEQKALRLQMNPHFIFNALNSIQSQIGTDNEQTARYYLAKFSRLMRQILDNSRNTSISLEEEVSTLENYLLIEKFCNGDRFDYTIKVDEAIEKDYIKIPPMLLQPFIENAIKHGLKTSSGRRGLIEVEFNERNNMLECSVTDNGIGRKKAEELNKVSKETYHKSTALLVTQERLDLLDGAEAAKSLEIIDLYDTDGEAVGTRVLLRVPLG